MRITKNILRTKERADLHPVLIGMIQFGKMNVTSPVSEPDYVDGYYQVTFDLHVDRDDIVNSVFTYERGSCEVTPLL